MAAEPTFHRSLLPLRMLSLLHIPLRMSSCFHLVPFQPLFKNIGAKPACQKGDFSLFSQLFDNVTTTI
jgi:hypothetical protein